MHTLPTVKQSFALGENHVANEMNIPKGYARSVTNFVLDNDGLLSTRRLFVENNVQGGHSAYVLPDGSRAYFFDGGLMYRLEKSGAVLPVFSVAGHFNLQGDGRVWYVFVNDTLYFSNGTSSGKIGQDGVASLWGRDGEVWFIGDQGDGSELRPTILEPFPPSRFLASIGGYIYGAVGNVVYKTQAMNYECYDPRYDFTIMPEHVTAVGSVADGLYVSTVAAVYFIKAGGTDMEMVSAVPAFEGSQVYVPFSQLGVSEINKKNTTDAFCWWTAEGLAAGMDGGRLEALGAGVLKLENGGCPTSTLIEYDGSYQIVSVLNCALSSAHSRAVESVNVAI